MASLKISNFHQKNLTIHNNQSLCVFLISFSCLEHKIKDKNESPLVSSMAQILHKMDMCRVQHSSNIYKNVG